MKKRRMCFALVLALIITLVPNVEVHAASSVKAGEYIYLGSFEQDNNLKNGKEMLAWRVLSVEKDEAFIISDKIIDTVTLYKSSNYSWAGSTFQLWCQNFINDTTNFSTSERGIIENTTLVETGTTEKVFFLSENEVVTYLPNIENRKVVTTEFTPSNMGITDYYGNDPILTGNKADKKYNMYWLRSYKQASNWVGIARDELGIGTCLNLSMANSTYGSRPGCYIDLSKISVLYGNGTIESPYVTSASNYSAPYIYDAIDPGSTVNLPYDKIPTITDNASAISAISSAAKGMTTDQKASSTGVDRITQYAEEAVAQSAKEAVSGNEFTVDQTNVTELLGKATETKTAALQTLSANGITTQREMRASVKFATETSENIIVTIDPSAVKANADNIQIQTPNVGVSLSARALKENVSGTPLVIKIEPVSGSAISRWFDKLFARVFSDSIAYAEGAKTYKVSFSKSGLTENVKVSIPPATGTPAYQAVFTADGKVVGGKYNPSTGMMDFNTKVSGEYVVKENVRNFSDIQGKSKEMQDAIKLMASKGIISGTSATQFAPDKTISRAEMASLLLKVLSKMDTSSLSTYSDVKKTDWYYVPVSSAKKYGLFSGYADNSFKPVLVIPKEQLVVVAARALRTEMNYKSPTSAEVTKYLSNYTDNSKIAAWAAPEIAYATRESLVLKRGDSKFIPSDGMTRGDVAIVLKRLYDRMW